MSGECNHCGGEHSCDEMAWCSEQVVSAIRDHTRAMVAERLWAQAEAGTDVNHVVADADALLAALSASSGGENDTASGEVRGTREEIEQATSAVAHGDTDLEAPCGRAKAQDFSAGMALPNDRDDSREPRAHSQAATPPLSAEAARDAYGLDEHETVTVRRDDLEWALDWIDPDDHDVCQRRQRLMDVLR